LGNGSRKDVAAFVDSFSDETGLKEFLGRPVITPDKLKDREYDLILVANRHADEILELCGALGLDGSRLFFLYNNYALTDRNGDYSAVRGVLPEALIRSVQNNCRVIRPDGGAEAGAIGPADDYVRVRALELTAQEIARRGVRGAAAELGVYRGAFAKHISRVFQDRKLYLFDTFEGFDREEAEREKRVHNCGDAFIEAHRNTGAKRVLALMPHPEQVILRRGLFPDSLNGLEETFAFVSLDVDFEASIYSGLSYFYPRLAAGGCIFIHDYNAPELTGVKRAVWRYETEKGVGLHAVPLPDTGGTLVITA
jgi:hypothetical protein